MMPTERVFHGIGKTVCAPPLQKWEETERERESEREGGGRGLSKRAKRKMIHPPTFFAHLAGGRKEGGGGFACDL